MCMNLIGTEFSQGGAKKSNRLAGFTLVEVMIGIAILAFGIVSLFELLTAGFAIVRLNRDSLRATQIMLNRIEGLRLYNWDQLTSGTWIPTTFTETYSGLSGTNQGTDFSGEMIIGDEVPDSSYKAMMRSVIVRVTWTSGQLQHTREMRTYVSQYGLQNYVFKDN